jgi:type IV pilus assembly protein PilA
MTYSNAGRPARGFTMIELMLVLTLIAVLLALAVPAYRDYTVRAKITECINGAAVAKLHISEYRQTLGAWPSDVSAAGIDAPAGDSPYCSGFSDYQPATGAFAIDIDAAAINPALGNVKPLMVPSTTASNIVNWDCRLGATADENVKYLPSSCRDNG